MITMKKAVRLFIASAFAVSFSAAPAPPASWTQLGLEGAEVRVVVRHPQKAAEVYVIAYGNPCQIFRSVDGGGRWTMLPVLDDMLYDLAIHPVSGALYALGDTVVYKSADKGMTWTSLSLGTNNFGFWGQLGFHPSNPNLIYVVGYRQQANYRRSMAFLKSADGGKTWTVQAFEPSSLDGYLCELAVSPSSPNVILAAGYFTDTSRQTHYRLYKSANGGKTWADKTGVLADLIRDIVIHPADPKKFCIATDFNIWRTADGGSSWTKNEGYASGYSLAVDPAHPEILYAGRDATVFRSLNGGIDWESSSTGIYGSVYDFSFPTGKILCGTSAALFACAASESAAAGGLPDWPSWAPSAKGLKAAPVKAIASAPSSPNILFAAAHTYGLFKSVNGGATWERLAGPYGGPYITRLAIHPSSPGVVYGLTNVWGTDALYRTMDGGAAWAELLSDYGEDFVLSAKNPSKIFVAGQIASGSDTVMGLHVSQDGGTTWAHSMASAAAGSCAYTVAVDPKNDAVVYLGGVSGGNAALFKSTDGGGAWTNITGSLTGPVADVAVDPKSSNRVYAATSAGIWKSGNGGTTWTKVSTDPASLILVHPSVPNILYAAGYHGIQVSKNYGAAWSAFDQGIPVDSIAGLDLNRAAGALYAAAYGAGIWKRTL